MANFRGLALGRKKGIPDHLQKLKVPGFSHEPCIEAKFRYQIIVTVGIGIWFEKVIGKKETWKNNNQRLKSSSRDL